MVATYKQYDYKNIYPKPTLYITYTLYTLYFFEVKLFIL